MASNVTAPTPRVTRPCRTSKDQYENGTNSAGESCAYSDMNEMPVGRVTVIRAVLTHGSHEDPVLEGETTDTYGLEELWECLILGEIGLEREKVL